MPININRLQRIKTEIDTDLAGIGYPAVTTAWISRPNEQAWQNLNNVRRAAIIAQRSGHIADCQAVADVLNTANRQVRLSSMPSEEILKIIDDAEFDSLTQGDRNEVLTILSIEESPDPFGLISSVFERIFGNGSTTFLALVTARTKTMSRGEELILGRIKESDIRNVKTL